MRIAPDMLVDDVMQRWPATIRVFLDMRMRCVGCPVACFHTVDDAAREHGVDREALMRALRSSAGEIQAVIASEAKQSRGRRRRAGLLRGACHRAGQRPDPVARNDEEG
jgi:hybrid cluster-associated redox disulfide protein